MSASVAQSLAGRTGLLELFPPSWRELERFPSAPRDLFDVLWTGSYPRIFDRQIPAHQMKQAAHRGERAQLFHYRDAGGLEVHLVSETAGGWLLTEAKSGAPVAGDSTKAADQLAARARAGGAHPSVAPRVIYGGAVRHARQGTDIVPWSEIHTLAW